MNSFALFVVVLLAALVNFSSAANSCSRFVTLNLQSPASSTIGVKTKRTGKAVSIRSSKQSQIPIRSSDIHYLSFSPASKTLQVFFGKDNGCSRDASLAFEAPKGYHWEVATVKGSKPCSASSTACVIETGVVCSPSPVFRLKLGGKVKSTVVLNLVKGKYSEC